MNRDYNKKKNKRVVVTPSQYYVHGCSLFFHFYQKRDSNIGVFQTILQNF